MDGLAAFFISSFSFHSINTNSKLRITLVKKLKKEDIANFVLTLKNTF